MVAKSRRPAGTSGTSVIFEKRSQRRLLLVNYLLLLGR